MAPSTHQLKLNKAELQHLRDLFSIMLPLNMELTVSQALAESNGTTSVEALLWQKVLKACGGAKLPIGEKAPDYAVVAIEQPRMGVTKIVIEPSGSVRA